MALPVPRSLSPSKVGAFKDCALAFRFAVIDGVPELPSEQAVKGTLVHRALEQLFWAHDRGTRSLATAHDELEHAWERLHEDPEFSALELTTSQRNEFLEESRSLVERYFHLEDPDSIDASGIEVTLEAEVGGLLLRGIIDRLDVTADGQLVVVDYKTGRAPSPNHEQSRLGGVQFYALLCEEVLGRRPSRVRLMYLGTPVVIEATPSDQVIRGLRQRTAAVWSAIERACETEDFRPRPSALCSWCQFQALCPAFGGDPAQASRLAVVR
jgi:putative RecB family exonuclease